MGSSTSKPHPGDLIGSIFTNGSKAGLNNLFVINGLGYKSQLFFVLDCHLGVQVHPV
jgi:hypothetical protein